MNLTTVAASFQEYFLASGCEGQAHSAIGLIGPRFAGGVVPAAMSVRQPTASTPAAATAATAAINTTASTATAITITAAANTTATTTITIRGLTRTIASSQTLRERSTA